MPALRVIPPSRVRNADSRARARCLASAGPWPGAAATDVRALLSLNGAAILLFGILPGGLMALCTQAIMRALAS